MRILLVEDDPGLGRAVQDQILAEGHSVDRVMTVADARACVDGVGYDLVLLDLMLPDGSGLSFLRDLRARGSVTPVIILTARDRITERIGIGADHRNAFGLPLDGDGARAHAGAHPFDADRTAAGANVPKQRIGKGLELRQGDGADLALGQLAHQLLKLLI